jgi:hypothetical protein
VRKSISFILYRQQTTFFLDLTKKNNVDICVLKKNMLPLQTKSMRLPCKGMLIFFKNNTDRGVEQLVARQAHNLEVACSSLASATSKQGV